MGGSSSSESFHAEVRRIPIMEKSTSESSYEEGELKDENQISIEDIILEETDQNKLQGMTEIVKQLKIKCDEEKFAILLLGFVSSGKSSFIESLKTISKDTITNYLPKGAGDITNTARATEILFDDENELLQNISILDIAGLQEADEKHGLWINSDKIINHISNLIEGNIGDGFKYTKALVDDVGVDGAPKKQAVVFFCRAKEAEFRLEQKLNDESIKPSLERLMLCIRGYGLSPVVVLTACDEISEEVSDDPSVILRSTRVKEARMCAAKLYEVNVGSVFPVINYTDQFAVQPKLHPPLLFALFKIVSTAHCYIQRINKNKDIVT